MWRLSPALDAGFFICWVGSEQWRVSGAKASETDLSANHRQQPQGKGFGGMPERSDGIRVKVL
jgi:hypothetical protein